MPDAGQITEISKTVAEAAQGGGSGKLLEVLFVIAAGLGSGLLSGISTIAAGRSRIVAAEALSADSKKAADAAGARAEALATELAEMRRGMEQVQRASNPAFIEAEIQRRIDASLRGMNEQRSFEIKGLGDDIARVEHTLTLATEAGAKRNEELHRSLGRIEGALERIGG